MADPPDRPVRLPIVALVGRPNVGKSALFNRFVGERVAVVEDFPGTTRDRIYGELEWRGRAFALVDAAGIAWRDPAPVAEAAVAQAEIAADEADLLLVVTDVTSGVADLDQQVARRVLRSGSPHLLVVNKADTQDRRREVSEFAALGLGEPHAVSALHGTASGDLLDAVIDRLPAVEYVDAAGDEPRISIVGRPNVGKSSLLNAILGEERALVHAEPGTTRDSVDTVMEWDGRSIRLVDTAGMRRRGHIVPGVERHSVMRAVRSMQRADVGILVVDAAEGPTNQDAHVAGMLLEAGKGVVVAVNKWDLVTDDYVRTSVERNLERILHFLPESPLVRISARTGLHVRLVPPAALDVFDARRTRVTTSRLNGFLRDWIGRREPPSRRGRPARFRYATQTGVDPPTFLLFFAHPEQVHPTYVRYLEHGLRHEFALDGTPVRVRLRES